MREIQNGKKVLGSLQYQPQVKIFRERKEKKNPLMSYSLFSIHFLQSQSRVDNTSTSQKRFYRSRSRSRFTKSHVGARLKIENSQLLLFVYPNLSDIMAAITSVSQLHSSLSSLSSLYPNYRSSPLILAPKTNQDTTLCCLTVRSFTFSRRRLSSQSVPRGLIIQNAATKPAKSPGNIQLIF